MSAPQLKPPGVVVNWLKGDPMETRANAWMEWDGSWDLDAVFVGAPFDGAGTVRSGSRHAPDAVRNALPWYTAYSSTDDFDMTSLRVADIGDVQTVVTDMTSSYDNIMGTTKFLAERGIAMAIVGGDNSITWPACRGVCEGMKGKTVAIVHFDAHHDFRESHYGALSSGVPYRMLLENYPEQVRGELMTQIGISDFCNNPTHARYGREKGVALYTNVKVWEMGLEAVIDAAMARAEKADAIYISIDIDGMDQAWCPGTAAPNPFGIDARAVTMAVRRMALNPKTVALEITELSPPTDVAHMTSNWAAITIMNFLYGVAKRKAKG